MLVSSDLHCIQPDTRSTLTRSHSDALSHLRRLSILTTTFTATDTADHSLTWIHFLHLATGSRPSLSFPLRQGCSSGCFAGSSSSPAPLHTVVPLRLSPRSSPLLYVHSFIPLVISPRLKTSDVIYRPPTLKSVSLTQTSLPNSTPAYHDCFLNISSRLSK